MADEEKTTVEVNDTEIAAQQGKGKSKMMLYAIIGVACIGLGIGGAFLMKKSGSGDHGEEAAIEETADSHDEAKAEKEEKKHEKEKPKTSRVNGDGPIFYAIHDIVVNPAGTGGSRYLSVSFGFELEDPRLATVLEERESQVRDALITILSSKTVAQLTDIKQKEIMRYQVKKRLSQIMETEDLVGVYYTDFVLQ